LELQPFLPLPLPLLLLSSAAASPSLTLLCRLYRVIRSGSAGLTGVLLLLLLLLWPCDAEGAGDEGGGGGWNVTGGYNRGGAV
jgi:hypothetical protein